MKFDDGGPTRVLDAVYLPPGKQTAPTRSSSVHLGRSRISRVYSLYIYHLTSMISAMRGLV